MVGLGAVAGCRLQGAERIICVDLSDDRLELARGQGATDLMMAGDDTVERILEMTDGGFGADYTFEATGNVKVMRQAVEAARMGWGLCTVAGVAGKGETLDVIPRLLITGRRVAGSSFGGVKGREGVPKLVDRYLQGEIDVDPFISHRITLDEVNRGFELMEAQDGIRSVIEFGLTNSEQMLRLRRPLLLGRAAVLHDSGEAGVEVGDFGRGNFPSMILQRVEQSEWLSNAYLAVDEIGGTGVLIDSNGVTDPLCERVEREGTTITHILLTHHHWDHVVGLAELGERFGASRSSPIRSAASCSSDGLVTGTIDHGDVLETGDLRIEAIHTPGHCADHLALRINDADCLTADVIFKGTVGGTGAPGATGLGDLKASIMDRLMELPNDVRLHPGHREPTTVIEEWENNPFIRLWRGLDEPGEERCTVGPPTPRSARRDAAALGARLRRRQQGAGPLRRRRRRDDHRRVADPPS